MPDELETILRLVAEGKLTPDEAQPIIEALTRAERATRGRRSDEDWEAGWDPAPFAEQLAHDVSGRVARANRHVERARRRAERATARAAEQLEAARLRSGIDGGRQLRIRVTERGRQVVNLRIPLAFAEMAGRMVPGIGEEHWGRIREAIDRNLVGPIVDVDDGDGSTVLISVE